MAGHACSLFIAVDAELPVSIGVIRPGTAEAVIAVVLPAASGACTQRDAGRVLSPERSAVSTAPQPARWQMRVCVLLSPLDCHSSPQSWTSFPYSAPHFSQVLPVVQVGVSVPPVCWVYLGLPSAQIHLSAIQTFFLDPMEFVALVFVRARKIP